MNLFSPIKTFLFLFSCLCLLLLVSLLFDNLVKNKENFPIKMLSVRSLLMENSESTKDSVEEIIKNTTSIEQKVDSIKVSEKIISADTLKIYRVLQPLQVDKNFVSKIEYSDGDKSILSYFAKALKNARSKSTHILYYGDSQIEEDRFSGFMRSKLQSVFGGSGCGLLPIMPVAQWIYPKITYSENWYKWDCFADLAKKDEHYGIMAQSFLIDFEKGIGKIKIKCNSNVSENCVFNKVVMYYNHATEPVKVRMYNNNELISEQIIDVSENIQKKIFALKNTDEIDFEIEGLESPYFYGISLEGFDNGVYVDNIALRGSSGTYFHNIGKEVLKYFLDELNVSLIVLQFGGNVMPMIKSEEDAQKYAEYIHYQLRFIKSIRPEIPILFVGPSDMSVNIDGMMQTHPYLESVIQHLREVVLKNRCAFFDMYKAMGGRNSMPIWVQENIAAKDYIHFSPAGARKMAALIYYSLIKDIEEINL